MLSAVPTLMPSWVVDASPLILLAKVDRLHLLTEPPERLLIPASVAEEIAAGPEDDPARRWLHRAGSRYVQSAVPVEREVAAWDIGRGESAVLPWAYSHPAWIAVIDDLAARCCAQALDIPFTGTLGIVLAAKRKKLIPEVGPLLDELVKAGLRISDALISEARRLAGES